MEADIALEQAHTRKVQMAGFKHLRCFLFMTLSGAAFNCLRFFARDIFPTPLKCHYA